MQPSQRVSSPRSLRHARRGSRRRAARLGAAPAQAGGARGPGGSGFQCRLLRTPPAASPLERAAGLAGAGARRRWKPRCSYGKCEPGVPSRDRCGEPRPPASSWAAVPARAPARRRVPGSAWRWPLPERGGGPHGEARPGPPELRGPDRAAAPRSTLEGCGGGDGGRVVGTVEAFPTSFHPRTPARLAPLHNSCRGTAA